MILLESSQRQNQNTFGGLLQGANSSNTFATILQGISLEDQGGKTSLTQLLSAAKEGRFLLTSNLQNQQESSLTLNTETPSNALQALLGSEEGQALELLHPNIGTQLKPEQLTQLIHDAKTYLKQRIATLAPSEQPPQTLKGAIQLAEKIGIDLTAITLEQVAGSKASAKATYLDTLGPKQPLLHTDAKGALIVPQSINSSSTALLLNSTTSKNSKDKDQGNAPLRQLLQRDTQERSGSATSLNHGVETATKTTTVTDLATPHAKQESTNPPHPKTGDTTGLSLLLNGNTTDTLEEGESNRPIIDATSKTVSQDISTAPTKGDLDVKIHEAKQTLRHFASSLNDAVENYKPPFTRIKIQLNPVKLGEVDVTMIQRGNNLHINISSNPAAVTTLTQNATELRTQLAQNGMGNATMNFSSNSDSQQQHHTHQEIIDRYAAFDNEDTSDIIERFEIIIPRYG